MSPTTRRACGQLLTATLKHAVIRKLIPYNPAADVPKARLEHKEANFLTADQIGAFLSASKGHRLYALFALAIGTGMRQGELLGLRWDDLDLDAGTVTVNRSLAQIKNEFVLKEPKSITSRRTISLPMFAVIALRDHRAAMLAEGNIGAVAVFCTRNGNFIAKTNLIRKVFQPILKAADLPAIRFHDLRHSHASNLLALGHSLKAVSQRLGHANVELTLRVYAHVMPAEDRSIADGLNKLFA
jgi:integrase